MDDCIGLDLLEEREHGIGVGDVAGGVLDAWHRIGRRSQVEDGDLGACFAVIEQLDNGVSQESCSAGDEDMAQRPGDLLRWGCHGGS